jgi:hypothetical protein
MQAPLWVTGKYETAEPLLKDQRMPRNLPASYRQMADQILFAKAHHYEDLPLFVREKILIILLNEHDSTNDDDYFEIGLLIPDLLKAYYSDKINGNEVASKIIQRMLEYKDRRLRNLFSDAYRDLVLQGTLRQAPNIDLIDAQRGFI